MKALAFEFLAAIGGLGTIYSAQDGRPLTVIVAGGIVALTFALIAVSASIQGSRPLTMDRPGPPVTGPDGEEKVFHTS